MKPKIRAERPIDPQRRRRLVDRDRTGRVERAEEPRLPALRPGLDRRGVEAVGVAGGAKIPHVEHGRGHQQREDRRPGPGRILGYAADEVASRPRCGGSTFGRSVGVRRSRRPGPGRCRWRNRGQRADGHGEVRSGQGENARERGVAEEPSSGARAWVRRRRRGRRSSAEQDEPQQRGRGAGRQQHGELERPPGMGVGRGEGGQRAAGQHSAEGEHRDALGVHAGAGAPGQPERHPPVRRRCWRPR